MELQNEIPSSEGSLLVRTLSTHGTSLLHIVCTVWRYAGHGHCLTWQ